jgi:hypothetical protein
MADRRHAAALVLALAFAAVALLAMAGCGGGDEDSTTAERPAITKKQFVREGQALCTRAYRRQARWMEAFYERHGFDSGEPSKKAREAVNAAVVMKVEQEKIDELDALPVPPGDEKEIEQILESMERGIRVTEREPERLAEPTEKNPEPFMEARELTADYGIWICGQP